jgi:LysM repeat protein
MRILTISFLLIVSNVLWGQQNPKYVAYIEMYKEIAIEEMRTGGIPASIKLAQAILESAAGTSNLAVKANNHFGIKCHNGWEGKKMYHDDDAKDECFRKYKKPEESFRDHTEFLRTRTRYAALFDLDITDYKGWAHGLSKAGYATNPKYPQSLISLIETYDLTRYDRMALLGVDAGSTAQTDDIGPRQPLTHPNSLRYIVAQEGDSFESIAAEMRISVKKLLQYNEMSWEQVIHPGDIIFLQSKRKRGPMDFYHVNREGETMWQIAHQMGMRLESLYAFNLMAVGEQPAKGQQLWLRRTKK